MVALRGGLVLCLVCIAFIGSASALESSVTLASAIGPQALSEALAEFGRQTRLQLIYVSTLAESQQSKGARAGLAASAALSELLNGTGLSFEFLNARTVRIFPAPAVIPAAVAPVPVHQNAYEHVSGFEEVVVTATRRAELLSQVPIDMAVWTQEAMEASGVKGMAQIGPLTPGVDFGFRADTGGDLYTDLAIRGVANRHGAATGIYLDDTSIPPTRTVTYLQSFPLTFDLDRVEILRGPQGTLLGDHAQGGAVRFITHQPSLTEFSGLARAEWGTMAHGSMSYEVGAAAGGPMVSEVLGFRVSAWYRADGGYVDRVDPFTLATVDANANRYLSRSVRAALTLVPAEGVRITPTLTYQSTSIHDTSTFYTTLSNPPGGELRNGSLLQQPFENAYYLTSLKITAALGLAELSSVTSYFRVRGSAILDGTPLPRPPPDRTDAVSWAVSLRQEMFSQELRLASADSNTRFEWMAGTLYSHEHMYFPQQEVQNGLTAFADAIDLGKTQIAGFGQLALRLSKRLTATAGARIGRSEYDYGTEAPPALHDAAADTWITPRFVVSYQPGKHYLLYVTAAKGYGSGGVYPGLIPFTPQLYPPDTLWSYEIGSKTDLWDDRVHLDASVFHIHWNNGPPDPKLVTGEQDPVPGTADSNGFDLTVQALAGESLRAALALSYVGARFTQTLTQGDAVFVRKGDTTAGSPWNVTASIEQNFRLPGDAIASIRAEDTFHSRNPGPLYSANPASPFYDGRVTDPSKNVLNLRAEVKWMRFDAAAFLNNALDSQPTFWRAPFGNGPTALTLTPRTLGVSGSWQF